MPKCLRSSCGHDEVDHDRLSFCELCPCVGFLHPDDALLEESQPFSVDEEDEEEMDIPQPLDFTEDGDR